MFLEVDTILCIFYDFLFHFKPEMERNMSWEVKFICLYDKTKKKRWNKMISNEIYACIFPEIQRPCLDQSIMRSVIWYPIKHTLWAPHSTWEWFYRYSSSSSWLQSTRTNRFRNQPLLQVKLTHEQQSEAQSM